MDRSRTYCHAFSWRLTAARISENKGLFIQLPAFPLRTSSDLTVRKWRRLDEIAFKWFKLGVGMWN